MQRQMEKHHLVHQQESGGFSLKSLRDKLASLDAYPKTLEDFRIKTLGGATVTFLSCSLIALLFLFELNYYLTPYVHEELMIDISSGKKLKIAFDITFPHVGCSHLSLDATDISGEQHVNIEHNVFKRRLDDRGDPIELPKKDNTITTKKSRAKLNSSSTEDLPKNEVALDPKRCESCYGASAGCCNTCKEVRDAYNAKGWAWHPADIEQCRREGITDDGSQSKEGCQVFGSVEVNKIAGNFHLALGQSFEKHHVHVHDINLSDLLTVNTSHTINHLSFGQKLDNTVNQLDGVSYISEEGRGLATFQYYIKIIPTIFQSLDGEEIQTNQFSVTRYKKDFGSTFDAMTEGRLPGVFFIYEFAPMMVKYSEKSRSFVQFLTTSCGIVGGILTGRGLATFQYYIKIIPTIFQSLDGEEIQTNQFSVTRYKKDFGSTFDAMTEGRLPGVFFIYEFAPMMVKYSEKSRSFVQFLTTSCGIVGGILTVAGIIDSFIYHSVKVLRAKIQIGKFS